MKTAIYCRVSTDDQEKEGTSLQTQCERCLEYCQQKGYQVIRQFSETFSGLTLDRPELIKLRALIRASDIDVVVVYCLDRLSRNATQGVILRDELDKNHIFLESVTEDIDKSPLGEAITYLRGTFAQIEAEKIRERTMRGKLARLKEGKVPHGTGIGIYGYDWHKDIGRRTINELEAKVVQKVFAMLLEGSSFHKIAIELNNAGIKSKSGSLWHPLTIKRILSNETYTGKTYSGKTRRIARTKVASRPQSEWYLLPDVTPLIIDDVTFKRTQEAIAQAKQSRPLKEHSAYLLTGFIKCSKCGSPIGGTTLNGKYRYYKCRGSNPTTTRGKICDAGYIKANELESSIWSQVLKMLSDPVRLLETHIRQSNEPSGNTVLLLTQEIEKLRKKLKTYTVKEKNLYRLISDENATPEYVHAELQRLKQQQAIEERELATLVASRKEAKQASLSSIKLTELSLDTLAEISTEYMHLSAIDMQAAIDKKRNLFSGYI